MIRIFFMCTAMLLSFNNLVCQNSYKLASLKYSGGGDWYSNPSSLNNLIKFCNKNIGTNIIEEYDYVSQELEKIIFFDNLFLSSLKKNDVVFNSNLLGKITEVEKLFKNNKNFRINSIDYQRIFLEFSFQENAQNNS